MLCPRCEQDDIAEAKIRKMGSVLFVCQECEATWFSREEIGVVPFVDFGTHMESIGLAPLWDELEITSS